MKLTKYTHSCVVLEEKGKKLVIDPGTMGDDFGGTADVIGVVVTHVHGDHYSPAHLDAIVDANPEVIVFTTPEVAEAWGKPQARAVKAGEEHAAGPFLMHFFGDLHNVIHKDWPQNQNVGVMVNEVFYTPGDSYTEPDRPVKVLAVPAEAPWLQVGDAIDFMRAVKPTWFMRTHDGLLNDSGIMVNDTWFKMASEKFGPTYKPLKPGESAEL